MRIRRGGYRYCPYCRKIVETRVLPEGYRQQVFRNVLSKGEKRSAAWTGKEEEGVDMNGSLTRFQKRFWVMRSVVRVPGLVGNEGGKRRARDAGEGRCSGWTGKTNSRRKTFQASQRLRQRR